jgi:hypothetical protein
MLQTLKHDYKRLGFSAGVRAEEALKGRLVNLDFSINNSYFNLFPTLHLSYKIKDESEIQLNYS